MMLLQSNMALGLKEQIQGISADIAWLAPEITLVITAVLLLIYDLIFKENKSVGLAAIAFVGMAFTLALLFSGWGNVGDGRTLMGGMIRLDGAAVYLKALFSIGGLIGLVMMLRSKKKEQFFKSSEMLLLFFGLVLGTFLMTMSINFLMVYVAIELVSICSYVLTGLFKSKRNSEAAMKYLLFGAVASAVMIYGMSWLYGFTGTLDFTSIAFAEGISRVAVFPLSLALIMTIGGFVFKLGAFPFHIWSPDVYEASPTPIVAIFSSLPKLAALAILFRFVASLDLALVDWQLWLGIIAIASMTVGNFSALWQKDVKRMLAYSSIAHAGFLLVGVLAFSESGATSALFYGSIYLLMNFGAFFLIQVFENKEGQTSFNSLRGMGTKLPYLGVLLLIVMISLTGLPPMAGFNAKLYIFSSLWESWQIMGSNILIWVFIFGLLNTAVSLFFYLKIPYYMFFKGREEVEIPVSGNLTDKILGTILVLPLLLLFFKSDWLLNVLNSINFAP
ncbi:NADH-quinone oxidoreductase subunit N [Roseivirga sp.]|uniref:NADH-quinone oxidoreductase subunit N n=1 Tax=Roseivirga sp. TaxID=1964215 RepID=UPI002B273A7C|nr:NADH-quinone oxidoreductase subunit N [Roseivirga sp.]